jgi:hypothetical protein
MKEKQKQKTATRETINGAIVTGVALNKSGIPMLTDKLGFLTVGRSGSIRDRTNK